MLTRLLSTLALSLEDLFLTLRLVNRYGLDAEANPFGRWILADPVRIVFFKVLLVSVGLVVLWIFRARKAAQIGSYAVFIIYFAVLIYHLIIANKY